MGALNSRQMLTTRTTGGATTTSGALGRWATRALVPVQLGLAALFVAAGVATLAGLPGVLAQFGTIGNVTGVGAWLRLTVGAFELLGGALLCVRAAAGVGAVLLGAVMVGAVLTHVLVLRSPPTAPAAFGVVLAGVAYAHRRTLAVVAAHLERNL